MSQVHQPRRNVLPDRIKGGPLHLCEEKRMEAQVKSEAATETDSSQSGKQKGNKGRSLRKRREGNRINQRDPNLDHLAVRLYRDIFHLCPNWGFRKDIASTVKDLGLWQSVITHWGYQKGGKWIKYSPLNIKGMLAEYERVERKDNQGNLPEPRRAVLPERVDDSVPEVQEETKLHHQRDRGVVSEWLSRMPEVRRTHGD